MKASRQQNFTPDEHKKLIKLVKEHGRKWTRITQEFPGRTEKSVRNKYLRHPFASTAPSTPPAAHTARTEEESVERTKVGPAAAARREGFVAVPLIIDDID